MLWLLVQMKLIVNPQGEWLSLPVEPMALGFNQRQGLLRLPVEKVYCRGTESGVINYHPHLGRDVSIACTHPMGGQGVREACL